MSEVEELKQREAVAQVLREQGVFKGEHGLTGLADAGAFWEGMPYETRLEYGPGISEYLHRSVLRAAIKAIAEIPELKARIAALEWELMLHQTGWAGYPNWVKWRATDSSGHVFVFQIRPVIRQGECHWTPTGGLWRQETTISPPADFTATLEARPVREAKP